MLPDSRLEIEEWGTKRYPSLEDAQEGALRPLAEALAAIIRSGLDNGRYIVQDGLVRVQKEADDE